MLAASEKGFLVSRISYYVCRVSVATFALSELRDSRNHFAVLYRKCERFSGASVQIAWKAAVL